MLLAALLLCAAPSLAAQNPAAELAALQKELAEAETAFYAKADHLPEAEREKAFSTWSEQQDQFFGKAEALANAHKTEEFACESLVWIVVAAGPTPRSKRCFERLLLEFPKSERLSEIPASYIYVQQVFVDDWFGRLASAERPAKVRGTALLAQAQHRLRRANAARTLRAGTEASKLARTRWYADWVALLDTLDPDKELLGVEALFERVTLEFADVEGARGKLGPIAKASLHELRDLAIGKIAPEIEGHDVESAPFKLSDYRGKVVLLDFWGHW